MRSMCLCVSTGRVWSARIVDVDCFHLCAVWLDDVSIAKRYATKPHLTQSTGAECSRGSNAYSPQRSILCKSSWVVRRLVATSTECLSATVIRSMLMALRWRWQYIYNTHIRQHSSSSLLCCECTKHGSSNADGRGEAKHVNIKI